MIEWKGKSIDSKLLQEQEKLITISQVQQSEKNLAKELVGLSAKEYAQIKKVKEVIDYGIGLQKKILDNLLGLINDLESDKKTKITKESFISLSSNIHELIIIAQKIISEDNVTPGDRNATSEIFYIGEKLNDINNELFDLGTKINVKLTGGLNKREEYEFTKAFEILYGAINENEYFTKLQTVQEDRGKKLNNIKKHISGVEKTTDSTINSSEVVLYKELTKEKDFDELSTYGDIPIVGDEQLLNQYNIRTSKKGATSTLSSGSSKYHDFICYQFKKHTLIYGKLGSMGGFIGVLLHENKMYIPSARDTFAQFNDKLSNKKDKKNKSGIMKIKKMYKKLFNTKLSKDAEKKLKKDGYIYSPESFFSVTYDKDSGLFIGDNGVFIDPYINDGLLRIEST